MKRIALFGLTALFALLLAGCTANERARQYGGEVSYDIPSGQKVVNVTWKENDLWVLTRPMRQGETPETWEFTEKASLGWKSGKVVLKESK